MADNKKFNQLPVFTSLADTDIVAVMKGSVTSAISKADLKTTLGDQGITDISGQDLAIADNSTSAFITVSEVPAVPTNLSDFTNDLTEINGNTVTIGTGTLTLGTNTLELAGGDATITATGTATIIVPDVSGTMALTTDIPSVPADVSDLTDNTSLLTTGALMNVVEDTSPSLGGDLDGVSTYGITNVTSVNGITLTAGTGGLTITGGDVEITATGTGVITIPDVTGTMVLHDGNGGVSSIAEIVAPADSGLGLSAGSPTLEGIGLDTEIYGGNATSVTNPVDGGNVILGGGSMAGGGVTGVVKITDTDAGNMVTLDVTSLTGDKIVTFPDATGTIALVENTPQISSGVLAPTTTPTKVGDIFIDTTGLKLYFATGASASTDWTIAN